MHPTADTISAVCITLRRQSPRCATHRWDDLCSIQPSVETITGCATYHGDRLHTSMSKSKSSCVSSSSKGLIRGNPFRGEHIDHEWTDLKYKILLYWEKCFGVSGRWQLCDRISRRNRNRIRKCFNLFIRGPRWIRIMKKGGRNSRDTLPLSNLRATSSPWKCDYRVLTIQMCIRLL